MDSVYPEPLSRLHKRAVRKRVHGNAGRFKTQPITFSEIQEVDEEVTGEEVSHASFVNASKSELDLKAKFEDFKRQRDRDLRESRPISNSSGSAFQETGTSNIGHKSRNKTLESCGNNGNNNNKNEATDSSPDLLIRKESTMR